MEFIGKINFYRELLKNLCRFSVALITQESSFLKNEDIFKDLPSFPFFLSYDKNIDSPFKKILNYIDNLLFWILFEKESSIFGPKEKEKLANILKEFADYRGLIYTQAKKKLDNKRQLLKDIYNGIEKMVFMLTHRCQLRCRYCRAKKFNADMSKEIFLEGLTVLKDSLREEIQIHFFGGEPLLMYPLIVEGTKYAKNIFRNTSKKVSLSITTNALLLDEEKIEFFKKNNFFIETSFEGDIRLQLTNRRAQIKDEGLYKKILDNIKLLIKKKVNFRVITVIMPKDVNKLFEVFIKLVEMGIKNIQINYALEVIWNDYQLGILMEEYARIKEYVEKHKDVNFVNLSRVREEPVILNREVALDFDGMLFFETGFHLKNAKFNIGFIKDIKCLDIYTPTPFTNFYMLTKNYEDSEYLRRVILNNLKVGLKLKEIFEK
jgi:sulfatase maturation enzyme AslB (radical SAM superfamily)